MSQISRASDYSTLVVKGRVITAFAAGPRYTINAPNAINMITNSVAGTNAQGNPLAGVRVVVLNIEPNSDDDTYLRKVSRAKPAAFFESSHAGDMIRDGVDHAENTSFIGCIWTDQPEIVIGSGMEEMEGVKYTFQSRDSQEQV